MNNNSGNGIKAILIILIIIFVIAILSHALNRVQVINGIRNIKKL